MSLKKIEQGVARGFETRSIIFVCCFSMWMRKDGTQMSGESSTWEAKKWHGERSEWITPNEGTSRIQVVFADTTCCSRSFDTMLSASPFLGYWVVKRLQTVSRGCEGFKNKHRLGVVFRRILFYQTIAQVSGWEFFDCLSSTNFLQTTKNKCSFFWCKHNSTQEERFFNF